MGWIKYILILFFTYINGYTLDYFYYYCNNIYINPLIRLYAHSKSTKK